MGRSYLIDHCVRYYKRKVEERNFRVNLTETNRGLFCYLTGNWSEDDVPRFANVFMPEKEEKKELTEQEVVNNIREKLKQAGE